MNQLNDPYRIDQRRPKPGLTRSLLGLGGLPVGRGRSDDKGELDDSRLHDCDKYVVWV